MGGPVDCDGPGFQLTFGGGQPLIVTQAEIQSQILSSQDRSADGLAPAVSEPVSGAKAAVEKTL